MNGAPASSLCYRGGAEADDTSRSPISVLLRDPIAARRYGAAMTRSRTTRYSVVYDPDAVADLLAIKSKREHGALLNAVRKLGEIGEQLGPPHMKPLKGKRAATLRELRPRQGRSDWRAIYRRAGDFYAILAIDRHMNFESLIERAQARAGRYDQSLED